MYRIVNVARLGNKQNTKQIIQTVVARQSTSAEAPSNADNDKSSKTVERIILPKKINRRPTDLLYTLSRTVGRDPTAPHYRYHDDPYLAPTSIYAKEQYALSQESGKRTAQWIRQQHADLFDVIFSLPHIQLRKNSCIFFIILQSKTAQPKIEAFIPKQTYTEESDVSDRTLQENIDSMNVTDAVLIYKILKTRKIDVSNDVKQSLLELVCYYNHNDPIAFDMFEERSSVITKKRSRDAKPDVWVDDCFADQLFESIEPKTAAAYNTMIRALYKYNKQDRAQELFKEAEKNEMPLDCATYNSFIQNINKNDATAETRWDEMKTILKDMDKRRIKPNVHTLNAILSTVKLGGNIIQIQEHTCEILAEFKRIGIEPSLETYANLLDIFHGKQSPPGNAIDQILTEIEKNPNIQAQSVGDFGFFYKAMEACRFRIRNSAAYARRIDNIITYGDNIRLLGDTQQELMYHRHFLCVILHNEPFPEFIRIYDALVPETYSLEPSVADDIFSTINVLGVIQYIPKFWSDMVICGISKRTQINETLLALMTQNQPVADIPEHDGLVEQFSDVAWHIYEDLTNEQFSAARKEQIIEASRLSLVLILLLRAKRYSNAKTIIEKTFESKQSRKITGSLLDDAISAFIDAAIENNDPSIAIKCIDYSIENGVGDAIQYAKKIIHSHTLNPTQIKRITDLVGQDVFKPYNKSAE